MVRVKTSDAVSRRIRVQQPEWYSIDRKPLDVSKGCEAPVLVHIDGAPDKVGTAVQGRPEHKVFAELEAPCRKCAVCLNRRRQMWGARGAQETAWSVRTWFGTLTARPEVQVRWLALSRRAARKGGHGELGSLPVSKQMAFMWQHMGREVTLFLKRIRKESGVPLRYFVVAEAHKSGLPHAHILLHERGGEVRKRSLENHWRSGFSQWRLVEANSPKAAFYVAKYLAKSADARIRASASYGRIGPTDGFTNAFGVPEWSERRERNEEEATVSTIGANGVSVIKKRKKVVL